MPRIPTLRAVALLFVLLALPASAAPFTAQDLVEMRRLSDPQASPDGRHVAYVLRSTDLEADRGKTDLWIVDLEGTSRRMTTHPSADFNPRWSADGAHLYFLSTRSGAAQVWRLPTDGGEAEQVTDLPLDVGNLVVSPGGGHLAFSLEVFADCETLDCTAERLDGEAGDKTTGRLYDQLFVRHWDTWKDGRRSHLFVLILPGADAGSDALPISSDPIDISGALDADVPAKPFGGPEEITFAPPYANGEGGIVFTARTAGREEPWSTNFDLFHAPLEARPTPRRLTDNPAWDTNPVFSPDGTKLAYLAMERPGYESDRFRIILRPWPDVDRPGETKGDWLTDSWDRSSQGITWAPDGKTIYTTATDLGKVALFAVEVPSGDVERVVEGGHVRSPTVTSTHLIYGRDHLRSPVDLFARSLTGGEETRLTEVNAERLSVVDFGEPEQFTFEGWNREKVHAWLVKPAGFDESSGEKVPLAFLIHGGPQGSFGDDFHYRWNPQFYAGAGYAALMIDFHGSTGYGQAFTDSIRGDWGGKPLVDLQKGLAAALERYPWIDGGQVCALGASYGGYMINWIAGNWPERFDCLVNHDGLFDLRSMYYTTEELWFPEWDIGGPEFENPEAFERQNPARFVDRWQTPMLVIHGALDYRVVDTQGLQAFTALQRRGVPSQLLYFPDENHWVLKPNNSLQWHAAVLDWLDRWLRPDQD